MPSGIAERNVFYVYNDGDWEEFQDYEYFRVKKTSNGVSEFEIKLYDIQDTQKAYLKAQAIVLFYVGTTLVLKGRVQTIEYGTTYECVVFGYGMEAVLLDKDFIKSGDKRVQYTNESAQTIAKEILSENSDGSPPWIMETGSDGLFSSDWGDVTLRFEYANRLNALGKLCEAINYDWEVYQDTGSYTDYFRIKYQIGETSSVKTFNIAGDNANCTKTERTIDINNLTNYIDILGYGDGVNQLKTYTYNASTSYSLLASDVSATQSSIPLVDASDFPSTGSARIAKERITYTGKSVNTLTGVTRGVASTEGRTHKKDVYVEEYHAHTSPESGSSIDTYGLLDYTLVDRTILDEDTLELIASGYLLERMEPIVSIKILSNEPMTDIALLNIGDKVTVNDAESGINDDYRIVTLEYEDNYGETTLIIGVSNRSLEFIEQMNKARQDQQNMQKYMQGSTNIYAISEAENCDADHPLNIRFFIPEDAVAINKVTLNFKPQKFRAYNETVEVNNANQLVGAADDDFWSGDVNYESWTNTSDLTLPNTDCDGVYFICSMRVSDIDYDEDEGGGSTNVEMRLYDGTGTYYPFSGSNVMMAGGDAWSDLFLSSGGNVTIFVPGNLKNKHFYLQLKHDDNDIEELSVVTCMTYMMVSRHTHDMAFTIAEDTWPTGISCVIDAGAEGSEVFVAEPDLSEGVPVEYDITDAITDVGAGNWANIKITPNEDGDDHSRIRIEGNAYIKLFIESTI